MRSLEVHVFETETDLDDALRSGVALPEQLAMTECQECEELTGICDFGFEPFVVVIDENDRDWALCYECASPMLDYVDAFFPPVTRSHFVMDDEEYEAL